MKKEYSCSCGFKKDFEGNEELPTFCPTCQSRSCRVVYRTREDTKGGKYCGVDALMKENVRLSWAMGCNEEDLPYMRKLHPGAEFVKAPGGGYQMAIHNKVEKIKRMKEHNFEEY